MRFNGSFDFITAENVHTAILSLEYFANIWRIEGTPGRLNDDDWRVLCQIVDKRDGRKCCNCKETNDRLDHHHIVPIGQGGTNRLTNIKIVCYECHSKIHPWMKP
jgi:5-methylcytosine-specific restriction endonuclease McrA